MQGIRAAVTVIGLAAFGVAAQATEPAAITNQWTVTFGVEAGVLPTYEGSDRYMLRPFPLFDLRKAGTPPTFHAPRDGFGFGLYDNGRLRIGPAVKIRFPRRESDDSDLRGLGVDWAFEVGAFADYWLTPWLRTRAELRQGFGGHHGIVSDLTADFVVPLTPQLTLSGGPRLTLATDKAEDPYYSVTASQAVTSGLPVYTAKGGIHSWGLGAQARYTWSPQWTAYTYLEYQQLDGDAANSPLVTQRGARDQIQVGTGITYSFDVPALW
ncbi:MAG TPA: MipA/OmpV family protein [Pseudolabrys sp.]|jgi:outer membrane protein|uniref:MipA/OmpV family protein n=1 Tax=Pseudolabrys sp. TaxID=1960880 RepID=UPI002DDD9913|nr:MipA/OmpV family protein [Pseudolabrys sp.]HEV2629072.1 MipA/OmpV family protein [Pseudolabrys sp.]